VTDQESVPVTEADWNAAQVRAKRSGRLSLLSLLFCVPALSVVALLLAAATATGTDRYPLTVVWMFVLLLPISYLIFRVNTSQQEKSDRLVGRLTGQLSAAVDTAAQEAGQRDVQARRQEFERRLSNALDMAEGEPEVIDVIERSFSSTLPGSPVELLLADNSHAHLLQMATASPTGVPPGCGVDSPDHCPAARRAQVQRFADSEDLDACPKLRGRPDGAVSALCVPVSIMGRTVGVIHATGEPHALFAEDKVQDLGTVANLAGARIGLLRVMAETQLQAATDSLTGLLNRRSFEQRVSVIRREAMTLSVAMADLDNFKALNDTYGHDSGDRALRLFARVLSESVRAQDLVCRHGGEEFVIALPGCSTDSAREILEALRSRLDAAITVAGLPKFTVSFGVIEASDQEDLPTLLSRADAALFQAKREGRDRVVVHDSAGNAVPVTGLRDVLGFDSRHRLRQGGEFPTPVPDAGLTAQDPSTV
jgi:diguanylate cyclase (GGDEF)-like protein